MTLLHRAELTLLSIPLVAITLLLTITPVRAETPQKMPGDNGIKSGSCAEVTRDCMIQAGSLKVECLYDASQNSACRDTALGRLVYQRWAMSPSEEVFGSLDGQPAPGFLGPQLINKECLSRFDNRWSGALVRGDTSDPTIQSLQTELGACKVQEAQLPRP